MAQKHKWRVAIIMAHDGETYFEYNDLEQSILNQTNFDNLSYFIFYYNQPYQKYSIRKAIRGDTGNYLRELPETKCFALLDFYKEETIVKFLKEIVTVSDDDETTYHYLVITWGHGGGLFYYPSGPIKDKLEEKFGINHSNNSDVVNQILDKSKITVSQYASLKANFSFTEDPPFQEDLLFPFLTVDMFATNNKAFIEDTNSALFKEKINEVNKYMQQEVKLYTAVELNRIFKEGLPKKIEMYFSLNCYTQMLETGFEFMESVEIMTAAQTTIPIAGINYFELFKAIDNDPEICQERIADIITSSFAKKYTGSFLDDFKSRYNDEAFQISSVSFSCNYLSEYEHFLKTVNDLTELFRIIYKKDGFDPNVMAVHNARKKCEELTPNHDHGLIDLTNFLEQLKNAPPPDFADKFIKIIDGFFPARLRSLVSIKPPDTLVSSSGGSRPNPQFLSIFAPAFDSNDKVVNFLLELYIKSKSKFSELSVWDEFVTEFRNKT